MKDLSSSQGEAVIFVAGAGALCCQYPILSVDVDKDEDDLPICIENAAVIDVVGAENYVDVVGSSTPVHANAGLQYRGFTFREAVNHAFVQESGVVVDTSSLPLYKFSSPLQSLSAFPLLLSRNQSKERPIMVQFSKRTSKIEMLQKKKHPKRLQDLKSNKNFVGLTLSRLRFFKYMKSDGGIDQVWKREDTTFF